MVARVTVRGEIHSVVKANVNVHGAVVGPSALRGPQHQG